MTYIHLKESDGFSVFLYVIAIIVISLVFLILEIRHMSAFFKLVGRCEQLDSTLEFSIQESLNKKSTDEGSPFDKKIQVLQYAFNGCGAIKSVKKFMGIKKVKLRYIEILFVYLSLIMLSILIVA